MIFMPRRPGVTVSLILLACLIPATSVDAAPSRASLQSEVDRLQTQISTLDEDFNDARIQLTTAERQIREIGVAKEEADRRLAELRQTASQRAAATYRMGVPNIVLVLFGSESYNDFSRRMGVSSRVGDWESGIVTELEVANGRSAQKEEELRQELAKAKTLTDSISSKRTQLQARVDEHEALMGRIAAEERSRAAAAAARGRTVAPLIRAEPVINAPPLPGSGNAKAALAAGYAKMGAPYAWGAGGPNSFDCSGFTSYAWRVAGVNLPHSSRAQYAATKRVSKENLQPGDLVFFGSPIHHVGMYVGGGNMIDASTYGKPVAIRSINRRGYVGAGRPGV